MMVEVELLIKGELLDPATLTSALGAGTRTKRKGETATTSTGHTVRSKIGVWALAPGKEKSFSEQIEFLSQKLKAANVALDKLPGVEEAIVDVFVVLPDDSSDSAQHVFELAPDQLNAIGMAGAKISFSIGFADS